MAAGLTPMSPVIADVGTVGMPEPLGPVAVKVVVVVAGLIFSRLFDLSSA